MDKANLPALIRATVSNWLNANPEKLREYADSATIWLTRTLPRKELEAWLERLEKENES